MSLFLHLWHVAPRDLHFPRCGVCCPQYRHTSTVDLFRDGCSLMSVRNGAVVRPFDSNCCSDTLLISGAAGSIDVFFIKCTSRCVSSRARALSLTIFKSMSLAIISRWSFPDGVCRVTTNLIASSKFMFSNSQSFPFVRSLVIQW